MAFWLGVSTLALLFTSVSLMITLARQWDKWDSDLRSWVMILSIVDAINMFLLASLLLYFIQYLVGR